MAKMKQYSGLFNGLNGPNVVASQAIPTEDTVNRQGLPAYSLSDELRLISMLNVLKLEPQYYRSQQETVLELQALIEKLAFKDPYFVAQCIIYSRCLGEGMRSINHLAAALIAPFISGQEWAKRFYGFFDKKNLKGGTIYRLDDMSEIKDAWYGLNEGNPHVGLTSAMRKGFAKVLETADAYALAKYKKAVIDVANLVHPNSAKSEAVMPNGVKVLDAIMQGLSVSANTWEVAQSQAGQDVANLVKEGKLTEAQAEKVLTETKNDNWEALLMSNQLGILAALRNLCNMLKSPRTTIIDAVCKLISNGDLIRSGKIMPYQIDYAYEMVKYDYANIPEGRQVLEALLKGYEAAVPNLAEALPGRTCVMVDCSGSMSVACCCSIGRTSTHSIRTSAAEKAGLIAATIAKATGADVIRFTTTADFVKYDPNNSVFSLGREIGASAYGGTSIPSAFELITNAIKVYDRIILLSDNECNYRSYHGDWTRDAYKKYVKYVADPYVYAVDLAAYGTVPVASNKVNYYFGYGFAMFEDISSKEFNPQQHIEKIRKIVI